MTKARELLKLDGDITLSSGVTVHIVPFPADLMKDIDAYAFAQFPDPDPPKKTIKVVDGEELVDDLDNEEYKAEKDKAEAGRKKIVFDAFLDECVLVELELYERDIKRIEKYTGPFPEDQSERKLKFLTKFAMRTVDDFKIVGNTVMRISGVNEERIATRRESFRPEMARPETNEAEASSPAKK